jgi:endoglucanase
MTRRYFLFAPLSLAVGYLVFAGATQEGRPASSNVAPVRRGVSLSGAEFGVDRPMFSQANPGTFGRDYTYNGPKTYTHFADQGLGLFRLPVRWERLQPRLGQDLDAAELGRLRTAIARAKKAGGDVIIDIHNYGRYVIERNGLPYECVIDETVGGTVPVTRGHFADLWVRLSQAFRNEPAVYAYGLMNEPHDMGRSDWKAISQAAVSAIRAEGDAKLILVPGTGWSAAHRFGEINGAAWINDPAGNVMYEAHCYFDKDNSGKYALSYDAEQKLDPDLAARGAKRLEPFVQWCKANGVRGFVGEFGVPGDDARWLPVLKGFATALDHARMGGCLWGGGEWWGEYKLSAQPTAGAAAPQVTAWKR